jgi:hypothetical protein
MGVAKLFVEAARKLQVSPWLATGEMLERLFDKDVPFAYIGGRAKLEDLVVNLAERIREKILRLQDDEIEKLIGSNAGLAERLRRLKSRLNEPLDSDELIRGLFGSQWKKDSGKYPDFILGLERDRALGDGAILELKDTKGQEIASFNSTIPTRYKTLEEVVRITKSTIAIDSATLFDLPQSFEQDYLTRERPCFYLVRTESRKPSAVRMSFVDGSFFRNDAQKGTVGSALDASPFSREILRSAKGRTH